MGRLEFVLLDLIYSSMIKADKCHFERFPPRLSNRCFNQVSGSALSSQACMLCSDSAYHRAAFARLTGSSFEIELYTMLYLRPNWSLTIAALRNVGSFASDLILAILSAQQSKHVIPRLDTVSRADLQKECPASRIWLYVNSKHFLCLYVCPTSNVHAFRPQIETQSNPKWPLHSMK